jgi:tetratricopeptide (TPR) repeat protein
MITTLRTRLTDLGRLDLLEGVGTEVERYYESAEPIESVGADALVRRAAAMDALAQVETHKQNLGGARSLNLYAIRLLDRAVLLDPANMKGRYDLAIMQIRVSEASIDLGELDVAEEHARAAVDIAKRLVELEPDAARGPLAAARAGRSLALVMRSRGKGDETGPLYADAVAVLEGAKPTSEREAVEVKRVLGWTYFEWGDADLELWRVDHAAEVLAKSRDVRAELAARDPGGSWKRDLAWSEIRLADAERKLGRFDAALRHLGAARDARGALAKLDPDNVDWQRDVAVVDLSFSQVFGLTGDFHKELASCSDAKPTMERLAAKNPSNVSEQIDLATLHAETGEALLNLGRAREAVTELEAALDIDRAVPGSGTGLRGAALVSVLVSVVRARLAAADVGGARAASDEALTRTEDGLMRDADNPSLRGDALAVAGDLAAAEGHGDEAEERYRGAIDAHEAAMGADARWPASLESAANARVELAKVVRASPSRGGEARSLLDHAVADLTPLEQSHRLSARGADVLKAARRDLAR